MEISFKVPLSIEKSPPYTGACRIVEKLRSNAYKAYIVGGAPRDLLLGKHPKDFDIATSARMDDVVRIFPHSHPLGASFGIVTVIEDKIPYEVASFREERDYMDGRHPETVFYTDDPATDVLRRDFTINALLYDPQAEKILDYTGGINDLRCGILRTVGNPLQRFSEDYLRILRAVRFATRFRYKPDTNVIEAIQQLAVKLHMISAERIRQELDLMLLSAHPADSFRMLSELGILKVILPEIEALHGIEQPVAYHPEGDVFEHTMLMLDHIAFPRTDIAWAILLHDVGKNGTQTFDNDGIPHFYGHEVLSSKIAEKILKRMRMPTTFIDNVCSAVRNHMRFAHVHQMKTAKWRRMLDDKNFPLELELHRIDCTASHGLLDNYVLLLDRMRMLESEKTSVALPLPFLKGADLLALGMKPGPEMGQLLNTLMDMQLESAITSREEALRYAKTQIMN